MNTFEQNIINIYGEKGKKWLADLPQIVQDISELLKLKDLKPINNLSYNYVLSGFQKEQPIILKLNPENERLNQEILTLKAFSKYGAIPVLDQREGAILMVQANPGHSLMAYFPLKELESIKITCNTIQRLHQLPLPSELPLPHLKEWLSRLDNEKNIPKNYLDKAIDIKNYLLDTTQQEVLLHGDLHPDNILAHNNEWVVIDPQGVIGDPVYELVAFIRNPIPGLLDHPDVIPLIKNRIKTFADLMDIDNHRIRQWCFVQAVLGWHWHLTDNTDPTYFERLTKLYNTLI